MSALLLACLLLPAPGASGPSQVPGVPARVEVLEGRAVVALPGGVLRLDRDSPPQSLVGPAHLEVPARSRVRVRWSGLSSVVLEGRNIVEWEQDPGSPGHISWRFAAVDQAHFEVRRGRLALGLPGGWSAEVEGGACFLRGISGGTVELQHDAGLPIALWAPTEPSEPRPPFTVLAGSQLRLLPDAGRPLALSGTWPRVMEPHGRMAFETLEVSVQGRPWRGFEWPWGAPAHVPAANPRPVLPEPEESREAPLDPAALPASTLDLPTGRDPVFVPKRLVRATLPPPVDLPAEPPVATAGDETPETPSGQPEQAPPVELRPLDLVHKGRLVLTPYGARWVADVVEPSGGPDEPPVESESPAPSEESGSPDGSQPVVDR